MRKEYRKAVRELFAQRVAGTARAFEPARIRSPLLFGGETVFRRDAGGGLLGFILLVPDAKGRQAFTVEIGWSAFGRFPLTSARPSVVLAPTDPPPLDLEEGIVRLGDLAARGDLWWSLPDPALERPGDVRALQQSLEPVRPDLALEHARAPVDESMTLVASHGVPFLEAWAARHRPPADPERRAP